jgi:5'-deoxynucleotidase YfbR-like HD superfamily hydrolase
MPAQKGHIMATILRTQDEFALDPAIADQAAAIREDRVRRIASNVRPVSAATAAALLTAYESTRDDEETRWAPTPSGDCWFTTVSGRKVSLLDPQPSTISIRDIAHSLANICRWNGHTLWFYSVADHRVHVSKLVEPELAMVGLLHDAAEAYLGDVVSPVKKMMADCDSMAFRHAEARLWKAICRRFHVDALLLSSLKLADTIAAATEKRDLLGHDLDMGCEHVEPHPDRLIRAYRGKRDRSPFDARNAFLNRFYAIREGAL